ncbi:MAG: outer membrane protein assembly factor [candidate division KSB1 bacterium]|nr:outer membrane protein assembly factor [candidate division KSB1 bacterium]MDZ7276451.1 outer membrane protein assembly factor [candidate division KSB1 bacterium]MDZ7288120.1 outer membrane protein assembly factor [candidate division KSB1 bacterium]MDZ7300221.1 outer membrane protein assembly factor [candidate division KSB1 bacterium]MDZ7309134.1 outer membrane protein assembly factor [candidate division KSB1 bacterium]
MMETATPRNLAKQLLFLLLMVLGLLIILGLLLAPQAGAAEHRAQPDTTVFAVGDTSTCDEHLVQQAMRDYLPGREAEAIRRFGDFELAATDSLTGDVVVAGGDVVIAGKLQGTLLVVCGNITLTSTAQVTGDVVAVAGRVKRFAGSRIDGDQIEASPPAQRESKRERLREWNRRHRRFTTSVDMELRYTRVDGLYLGGLLPRKYYGAANVGMFGSAGYGFKARRWQYQAGLELYYGRDFRSILGGEVHDRTDSEDEWIIPAEENTLAALLIKEDFRDYYRRRGFNLYARQHFGEDIKLTAGYRRDDLLPLENRAVWSLFGGDKRFRPNPAIVPGRLVSYFSEFNWDGRDHQRAPRRGWFVQLMTEFSRPSLDSDYDFDRVILDLRSYLPTAYGRNLDLRLRAGSSRGELPAQFLFDLGGLSSLPGYRFKEFTGNRMLLANLEYRMNAGRSRLHDLPIVSELNLILFVDSGMTWFAGSGSSLADAFDDLTWNRLKTDVGVAITDNDGRVRLHFAKRTDRGYDDLVVTFRLNRNF